MRRFVTYDAQRSKRALKGKSSHYYFLAVLDTAVFYFFSGTFLFAKFICLTSQSEIQYFHPLTERCIVDDVASKNNIVSFKII